jgi:glutamine amidotransferase
LVSRLRVVVIDYGLGNTRSVLNAVSRLGYRVELSGEPEVLAAADALVLPGVGAFQQGMHNLNRSGLRETLEEQVRGKQKPLLGICLGMQLLADRSEENGPCEGLGWIPGDIRRLPAELRLPVPHVGWNPVQPCGEPASLFDRLAGGDCFFFDHSYHFFCAPEYRCATADYGQPLVAAVRKGNIFGVQFHPEKSQTSGLKLLRGFFQGVDRG